MKIIDYTTSKTLTSIRVMREDGRVSDILTSVVLDQLFMHYEGFIGFSHDYVNKIIVKKGNYTRCDTITYQEFFNNLKGAVMLEVTQEVCTIQRLTWVAARIAA